MSNRALLVVLVFLVQTTYSWIFNEYLLRERGTHVVKYSTTHETTYKERCGFWNFWSSCKRHKTVVTYKLKCAPGWSSYYDNLQSCPNALCRGLITKTGACHAVRFINNTRSSVLSHGKCISPEVCNCLRPHPEPNYFYPDGPYCKRLRCWRKCSVICACVNVSNSTVAQAFIPACATYVKSPCLCAGSGCSVHLLTFAQQSGHPILRYGPAGERRQ